MLADYEKTIKGLDICTQKPCYCTDCPYKPDCYLDSQEVMEDALFLLRKQHEIIEQQHEIIEQYHRADGFLDAHGWKWN